MRNICGKYEDFFCLFHTELPSGPRDHMRSERTADALKKHFGGNFAGKHLGENMRLVVCETMRDVKLGQMREDPGKENVCSKRILPNSVSTHVGCEETAGAL